MVIRTEPSKETLKNLMKTIKRLINNSECYTSIEQIKGENHELRITRN